ncbi:MAG: hypothetical protein IPG81_23625 [Sandaracinaceae bacterium]|jgi:hypothetical protein|nr:hypothetical protein [Sandaracinaceae bacterium]MBK8591977.1 hypothetical protein [Sandaracinaceae bacterium]
MPNSKRRSSSTTQRGFGDTDIEPRTTIPMLGSPSIGRGEGVSMDEHGVELELVRESGAPQLLQGHWRAVEVWTANTIYALDAGLVCVSVLDRASYRSKDDHEMLGATMLGGQERGPGGKVTTVSHPLPRVGASAVFSKKVGNRTSISETSPVLRVIYRMRIVEVSRPGGELDWSDVSGRWPQR